MMKGDDKVNLIEAKKQFIQEHPLGSLTIAELKRKADNEDILVYGDKAQILQCFNQSKQMLELFKLRS